MVSPSSAASSCSDAASESGSSATAAVRCPKLPRAFEPESGALAARDRLLGEDERDRGPIGKCEHGLGQDARRCVGPLRVLDRDDHRPLQRQCLEPTPIGGRDVLLGSAGAALEPQAQEARERDQDVVDTVSEQAPSAARAFVLIAISGSPSSAPSHPSRISTNGQRGRPP